MNQWNVLFYDDFRIEFEAWPASVQFQLLTSLISLEQLGPMLGRPSVDTLKGSKYVNMKEFRFNADDGVYRIAFAFDPERNAILLVGGDKVGMNKKQFYKKLLYKADLRFDQHLANIRKRK